MKAQISRRKLRFRNVKNVCQFALKWNTKRDASFSWHTQKSKRTVKYKNKQMPNKK